MPRCSDATGLTKRSCCIFCLNGIKKVRGWPRMNGNRFMPRPTWWLRFERNFASNPDDLVLGKKRVRANTQTVALRPLHAGKSADDEVRFEDANGRFNGGKSPGEAQSAHTATENDCSHNTRPQDIPYYPMHRPADKL